VSVCNKKYIDFKLFFYANHIIKPFIIIKIKNNQKFKTVIFYLNLLLLFIFIYIENIELNKSLLKKSKEKKRKNLDNII
jgi:hypothetical protein